MSLRMRIEAVKPPEGTVAIFWLGQAGYMFKSQGGTVIYLDAYLSETGRELVRIAPIPVVPEEVEADLILSSHDHLDHLDPVTVSRIARANRKIKFGGSEVCVEHFKQLGIDEERIVQIEQGQTIEEGDFQVSSVFARHGGGAQGYIFNCGGPVVYATGDTTYEEELKGVAQFRPDILLVCINGKWGNMNAGDAAALAKELEVKLAIPMHYGMFTNNTLDPQVFPRALEEQGAEAKALLMALGGGYIFDKGASLVSWV